jgi:hypothetical protein
MKGTTWDDATPVSPTSIAGSVADTESIAESEEAESIQESELESGQTTPTKIISKYKAKVSDIDSDSEKKEKLRNARR